jgi:cytochrome b6
VLPGLVVVLLAIHLFLVQRQGMSVPPKVEAAWTVNPSLRREMRFVPNFVLREMMAWYVAIGTLGALAALFPWNLGVKADPFASAPAGIKPEWYFLFMYQTLKLIPSKVWIVDGEVLGILGCSLAGLFWLLLPFFESDKPARTRTWITGLGVFALVYMIAMSVYGYVAQ